MDTYEKKYNHALEVVRELQKDWASTQNRAAREIELAFPELRESEDERIRKAIDEIMKLDKAWEIAGKHGLTAADIRRWVKKQKEQKPCEDSGTDSDIMQYIEEGKKRGIKEVISFPEKYGLQKEQKPINSFDIVPYIDDKIAALQDMWREEKVSFDWDDMKDMIEDVARHFYHKEQKPVDDSDFKTKLAEYLTKNRTGGSYSISSESILQMAKEELIKRGELKEQKPAWSEEDRKMLDDCIMALSNWRDAVANYGHEVAPCQKLIDWLKSLPMKCPKSSDNWKPSEEQLIALNFAITYFMHETNYKNPTELRELYDDLLKLK